MAKDRDPDSNKALVAGFPFERVAARNSSQQKVCADFIVKNARTINGSIFKHPRTVDGMRLQLSWLKTNLQTVAAGWNALPKNNIENRKFFDAAEFLTGVNLRLQNFINALQAKSVHHGNDFVWPSVLQELTTTVDA